MINVKPIILTNSSRLTTFSVYILLITRKNFASRYTMKQKRFLSPQNAEKKK